MAFEGSRGIMNLLLREKFARESPSYQMNQLKLKQTQEQIRRNEQIRDILGKTDLSRPENIGSFLEQAAAIDPNYVDNLFTFQQNMAEIGNQIAERNTERRGQEQLGQLIQSATAEKSPGGELVTREEQNRMTGVATQYGLTMPKLEVGQPEETPAQERAGEFEQFKQKELFKKGLEGESKQDRMDLWQRQIRKVYKDMYSAEDLAKFKRQYVETGDIDFTQAKRLPDADEGGDGRDGGLKVDQANKLASFLYTNPGVQQWAESQGLELDPKLKRPGFFQRIKPGESSSEYQDRVDREVTKLLNLIFETGQAFGDADVPQVAKQAASDLYTYYFGNQIEEAPQEDTSEYQPEEKPNTIWERLSSEFGFPVDQNQTSQQGQQPRTIEGF